MLGLGPARSTYPPRWAVVQPAKFELVINARTAKALGVRIPDKVLSLADELIE